MLSDDWTGRYMTPGFDVTLAQPLNKRDLPTKEEAVVGYRENDALMVAADSQRD